MSRFDEEPDAPVHGECAAAIASLRHHRRTVQEEADEDAGKELRMRHRMQGATSTPKVSKEWTALEQGDSDTWLWFRRTDVPDENRHRLFQFVEVIDIHGATGEDYGPRYVGELSEVHLDALTLEAIERALASCGWRPDESEAWTDEAKAEACFRYGCRAPLGGVSSNSFRDAWRGTFADARSLDARNGANILRAMKLNMPVNRIGTSALDFMKGNLVSSPEVLGPNACTVKGADILKWSPDHE